MYSTPQKQERETSNYPSTRTELRHQTNHLLAVKPCHVPGSRETKNIHKMDRRGVLVCSCIHCEIRQNGRSNTGRYACIAVVITACSMHGLSEPINSVAYDDSWQEIYEYSKTTLKSQPPDGGEDIPWLLTSLDNEISHCSKTLEHWKKS
jgi:hypothetical protein